MIWLMLFVGVLLTLGTGVFVAAEFSLVALDRHTVEKARDEGDKGAEKVLASLGQLSTHLSGAQVGITITTLLFGFAVQEPLTRIFTSLLSSSGVSQEIISVTAVAVALAVAYAFSMIVGELIPKNMAISAPLATARVVAPMQAFFTMLFKPLIVMFNGTANGVLRLFGVEPQEELSAARSASELDALVRRSAAAGTLDTGTAVLLSRTLQLSERTAADVMTHRGAMISLRKDDNALDLLARTRESGHSRFPVIDSSEDDVVGVVQVRQAFSVPRERRADTPVSALMKDIPRVPETVELGSLLIELRELGTQMAVVVDEYGGTAGIVTLEDVVEEIVGEVSDEHDSDETDRYVPGESGDGSWLVSGLMRPDEVLRDIGIRLPETTDYDTLGGLVMDTLGAIPKVGDTVEVDGVQIEVVAMEGRRVDQVRLCRKNASKQEEEN
ncbi:hemolysin family protein [Dermabacteraceae bacterium P13138]